MQSNTLLHHIALLLLLIEQHLLCFDHQFSAAPLQLGEQVKFEGVLGCLADGDQPTHDTPNSRKIKGFPVHPKLAPKKS